MLKNLYVKNFALIDELKVNFEKGLNILTGETGAGKSIIIGALGALLGDKVDKDFIRQGKSKAVVEGSFRVSDQLINSIKNLNVDFNDNELILRREIKKDTRSRTFANDSPISISVLQEIGDLLVDLHGQHAHQSLLHVKKHIDFLDDYGVSDNLIDAVNQSYNSLSNFKKQLKELTEQERQLKERKELLEFQVKEIEGVGPQLGEEEELEKQENILKNSEKIHELSNQLSEVLYEGDNSVYEKIAEAESQLSSLSSIGSDFNKWAESCNTAGVCIEEVVKSLQEFAEKIEFDPQVIEEIRERLGQFALLKKKYGTTIDEVLKFCKKAENDLKKIDSMESDIEQINQEIKNEKTRLAGLAAELSENRKSSAKELEEKTVKIFSELGLKGGVFKIEVMPQKDPEGDITIDDQKYKVTNRGIDRVEFFISLNPGEKPKPLAKIASGGEISRIMLALKNVLAETDNIPVLIFDEIDSGISGRVAGAVGNNLKEVARKHQIICITHLPLIASYGQTHFRVEKRAENNRTSTHIYSLSEEERVQELAKLIGGEMINETTLQNARDLLGEAEDR
ncbi:MAG: DNA repair protein RecN [bacterium]